MDLPFPSGPRGRADVSVRPATPADAAEVARVQLLTWRTAYRDLLPPEVLDEWDDAAATDAWLLAVTDPPSPAHRVFVALDRDTVVGLAACAPTEEPDRLLEVLALLVEPRWGRRGHGSRLLAAVADAGRATGAPGLVTWVAGQDAVTARFLSGAGWAPDGRARTLQTGSRSVRQERWHSWFDEAAE